ncbi:cell division cycle protein 123 homolog [Elysia marginata]|uniref:Cell division cycle protein 123 homolog n=1 Tax=Elysia marginata TaxID=1093978 RepID=A0AAV4F8M2_9GAST|nr:cell division cycle protein 123 homolog [Elysia marginata]
MKMCEVLSCSFPEWYEQFKHITYRSAIITLPRSFMEYLNTDSVVLPENSNHGLYPKSSNMVLNEDDDDPDLRDEDLLKQYEDDWSTSASTQAESKFPDFKDFDDQVTSAIKQLGGRVFPKLNWSSPKDATWISFDKTLLCTCPSDIYLLLKSSEFISHDTDQPFIKCEDFNEASSALPVEYCLVLREWHPPDPSTEFRCFVKDNQLIGICQRNSTKFYPYIKREKSLIVEDISRFFRTKISGRFPQPSYVFDVTRPRQGSTTLVDFNPFGEVTDGVLFSWDELPSLDASCDIDNKGEKVPQFRCVESEEGVKAADYANYAIPLDIQDLVAGEDPYKFMDLMKMKIQSAEGDDSSSEDESPCEQRKEKSNESGQCSSKGNFSKSAAEIDKQSDR